jgi:hypothetical protein
MDRKQALHRLEHGGNLSDRQKDILLRSLIAEQKAEMKADNNVLAEDKVIRSEKVKLGQALSRNFYPYRKRQSVHSRS